MKKKKVPTFKNRPYIIYNVATSIDGKIATFSGDSTLSDESDWKVVHYLRNLVDGVMVGINTIIEDDSKLTVKFQEYNLKLSKRPVRIVVDSKLRINPTARIITFQKEEYTTIIGTTSTGVEKNQEKYRELINLGVEIIESDSKTKVNLQVFVEELKKRGINSILLEGGGTLAWGLLSLDLIDEIRIFQAPVLCGGTTAVNMIMGDGFSKMSNSPKFSLVSVQHRNDYIIMNYIRNRVD